MSRRDAVCFESGEGGRIVRGGLADVVCKCVRCVYVLCE